MRNKGSLAIGLMLLFFGVSLSSASDVHLFLGQKSLDDDIFDASDVDSPLEYGAGVTLDFEWPVMLTFDVLVANDDSSYDYVPPRGIYTYSYDVDVQTTELHAGVKREFLEGPLRPYVGVGLSFIQLDAEVGVSATGPGGRGIGFDLTLLDDDDSDIGFFLGGGLIYMIREKWHIGLDVRWSDASAELDIESALRGEPISSLDLDSGGIHYGITAGYHW